MEELNALIELDKILRDFIRQLEANPKFKYWGWIVNTMIKVRMKCLTKINAVEEKTEVVKT